LTRPPMESIDSLEYRLRARGSPADGDVPEPGTRQAAVVALLRDGMEILLIRRADRAGDPWSGHLALPGGRSEPGDPTPLAIAVREVREEVGIDLSRGGRILGRLGTVRTLDPRLPRIAVHPFVALAPAGAAPRPDPAEVKDAFWLPLASMRESGRSAVVRHAIGGENREWPAYPTPHGPVWGITERILTELLSLLD
jgi:8-oxo-dGTP pyrophosphatase MutT (NUDIX family)